MGPGFAGVREALVPQLGQVVSGLPYSRCKVQASARVVDVPLKALALLLFKSSSRVLDTPRRLLGRLGV